jgi:hypothetical protein
MSKHTVPYFSITHLPSPAFPNGRIAYRPLLQINLIHATVTVPCFALVDSGADVCSFPESFARLLRIPLLHAPRESMGGLGGYSVAHHWDVNVEIPGLTSFPVRAAFTAGLDHVGFGLLGQAGFFERFIVHFDLRKRVFELEA